MATTETQKLPECWQALEDCLNNGIDRVILYGASGIGKTYGGLTIGDVSSGAFRTYLDPTRAFAVCVKAPALFRVLL